MVVSALMTLRECADDFEVIVVNDGSQDYTGALLDELARVYGPQVRVIHHPRNGGYGAALRTGFAAARKEWIFYTDGDGQYDPRQLTRLIAAWDDERFDVVNGYKISRHDPWYRALIGRIYHHVVKLLFGFRLRDVDCDFRLMRRSIFDHVTLRSDSGTICLEMVKKFQDAGYRFVEVPVNHYHRACGRSQFFNFPRLWRTGIQLLGLWYELVWRARPENRGARKEEMIAGEAAAPEPLPASAVTEGETSKLVTY